MVRFSLCRLASVVALLLLPVVASAQTCCGSVINNYAKNEAVWPSVQMEMNADGVNFYNPTTKTTTFVAGPFALTSQVNAGPCPGCRDQSGAYTSGQTVWFYYIYNNTTKSVATISSLSAPPTGPTLPSGFDSWAPAFPLVISDDATNFPLQQIIVGSSRGTLEVRGNHAFYVGAPYRNYTVVNWGADCNAAPPGPVTYGGIIPVGVKYADVEIDAELHNGGAAFIGGYVFKTDSGACNNTNDVNLSLYIPVPSFVAAMNYHWPMRVNASRTFWVWIGVSSGTVASIDLGFFYQGYEW